MKDRDGTRLTWTYTDYLEVKMDIPTKTQPPKNPTGYPAVILRILTGWLVVDIARSTLSLQVFPIL